MPDAGWHPDPSDPAFLRWWDGSTWTDERQPVPPQGLEGEGLLALSAGILLAVVLPVVGFLYGLALVAGRRRDGGWLIFFSILGSFLWILFWAAR
jgi:hypothetical protein